VQRRGVCLNVTTLVLGIGSTILSDDGVGIAVARAIESRAAGREGVEFAVNEEGGFSLLEDALGFDRLVVIDAVLGPSPGRLRRLDLSEIAPTVHCGGPHGLNLATVLEFGRTQGLAVPREVIVYAVEIRDATTFGERLSPAVEARVGDIAREIERELFGG
jgi:hydrogenase maturation protease